MDTLQVVFIGRDILKKTEQLEELLTDYQGFVEEIATFDYQDEFKVPFFVNVFTRRTFTRNFCFVLRRSGVFLNFLSFVFSKNQKEENV